MKNKILVFFIFNLLLFSESISNKYNIIIADDDKLRPLFQNNPQILEKIAQKITINNLGAVIHLGNRVIFDKGGDFYTTSSKENLKTFVKVPIDFINQNINPTFFHPNDAHQGRERFFKLIKS